MNTMKALVALLLVGYVCAKNLQGAHSAKRSGGTVHSKKYGGGGNKQHMASRDSAALHQETDELKHQTVSLDVGKLIQSGRMAKGITQKELANKINEKPQVVNDYEAGRASPSNQVLAKIERVIGLKLRGKDKGSPLSSSRKKGSRRSSGKK